MKSAVCVLLLITVVFCVPEQKWRESEDGSKFYIEPALKFTWFQAWNDCARMNMSLMAIDSYEKQHQIDLVLTNYYNTLTQYWIGGHDYEIRLRYQWASTGEFFTFTNWNPNEPTDEKTDTCVKMKDTLQWSNFLCTNKLGYICEENQAVKNTCGGKGINAGAQDEFKNMFFYFNNISINEIKWN